MSDAAEPLLPAVRDRWSPSRFDASREVAATELAALAEAARWAPSAGNEQPWRFVFVPRTHERRAAVEEALSGGNAWAKRAAVLVVGIARLTRAKGDERTPNLWAEHDTGIATGFLLLQTVAIGLVGHPMAGWSEPALRAALGIPEDHRPKTVIAIGHHDPALEDEALVEREARVRTRHPRGEVARLGAFDGEPLP